MDSDDLSLILLSSVVFGLATAQIARMKGRNFVGWCIYGALCFPISLIHAILILPQRKAAKRGTFVPGAPRCPHCAEVIKPDAEVCPHCWRVVPVQTAENGPAESR